MQNKKKVYLIISIVSFSIVLAALAGLATLYVNGKLDLLHYNDAALTRWAPLMRTRIRTWTGPVWYIATTR